MADDLRYREIRAKLIPKASQALGELTAYTGKSETDIINRALQLYASIAAEQANGADIILHKEGEAHVLTWH